ncbi:MAG: hypothetical protein WCD79_16435, partial [Chthoniobacteraceae bacterium]
MNHPNTETVDVRLGERSYRVVIGAGILGSAGVRISELGLGKACAVVTDSNVGRLYADAVLRSLGDAGFKATLITVPAGEQSKSMDEVKVICDAMIAAGLDRKGFVVAL